MTVKPVILINPFEVPAGREAECEALWREAAAVMRAQPGFVATRLHRHVGPARFALVNVAHWESADHFHRAVQTPEFQRVVAKFADFPHFPALYTVAVDESATTEQEGAHGVD